jgi:glucose-1-phosphate thymidylyltransferase
LYFDVAIRPGRRQHSQSTKYEAQITFLKGVVLAGGLGSRLRPLTSVTNKHLLPVYNQPMIYYPIQTLVNAGIQDIMIVTGGNSAGDFLKLLGNGKAFGLKHINYTYQEGEGGIACGAFAGRTFRRRWTNLRYAGRQHHPGKHSRCRGRLSPARWWRKNSAQARSRPAAVRCALNLTDAAWSGLKKSRKQPKSEYAVIGIYMYDGRVFDIIRTLKPSGRGELEITDVNNAYIERGEMTWDELEGWWTDAVRSKVSCAPQTWLPKRVRTTRS